VHARSPAFRSIALAALASLAACGAQTDHGAAAPPETGTDAAALRAQGDEEERPSLLAEVTADPAKWMEEHLPRWKVYFGGSPYDAKHGLYTWPDAIDENAPLHVEREDPPVRFRLSAGHREQAQDQDQDHEQGGGCRRGRRRGG
jgi:hypothetical protein